MYQRWARNQIISVKLQKLTYCTSNDSLNHTFPKWGKITSLTQNTFSVHMLSEAVVPRSVREALQCQSPGLDLQRQQTEQQAHPRWQQRTHGAAVETYSPDLKSPIYIFEYMDWLILKWSTPCQIVSYFQKYFVPCGSVTASISSAASSVHSGPLGLN